MKNWIDEIIEDTVSNYNNRKTVIWGSHDTSKVIAKRLQEEHNIDVAFFVDSDEFKQGRAEQKSVCSPYILENMYGECYVIIPLGVYKSIKDMMKQWGYEKDKDYNYFCDCAVVENEEYYEDAHGNKVYGKRDNLKFAFTGYGSEIRIGENSKVSVNFKIGVGSNSMLEIGDNAKLKCSEIILWNNSTVKIGADTKINCLESFLAHNNSILKIGSNCLFNFCRLLVWSDAILNIGDCSTGWNYMSLEVSPNTEIYIGNDCMFSYNTALLSNDGHSIFDIKTKKNINSTKEISQNRKIIIGNHVWVGFGVSILYGTEIGSGSIVGAGSLVKSVIPNNCIATGVPARVIRRDVAWSRNNCSENISDCGEGYINFTED